MSVCIVYDGSVHIFYGRRLWRLTAERGLDSPDYPADSRSVYEYAPSTVDAAVYSAQTHQTYLFRGISGLFPLVVEPKGHKAVQHIYHKYNEWVKVCNRSGADNRHSQTFTNACSSGLERPFIT